jgi:uncharacterized protein (DUF2141 family)
MTQDRSIVRAAYAFAVLLLTLSCATLPLCAQDANTQEKGSISGTVVDGVTQQPLRGASVNLRGPVGGNLVGVSQSATADAEGRFIFNNLVPGRYIVNATKSGYLPPSGQGGYRNRGQTLLPGQHLDDVAITLLPGAVIAGHAVDEKGRPLRGAGIHAMKVSFQRGLRELNDVAQATTDPSGEYRFTGLTPGNYLLRATYTAKTGAKPAGNLSYASICYPGTSDFSACVQLSVHPGEQVAGIDLTFTPVHTFHAGGRVVNAATPTAVFEGQVSLLIDQKGTLIFLNDTPADAKGNFQFPALPPGSYTVVAQHDADENKDRVLWGMKTFTISDANIDDLKLEVAPGADVRGQLRVEGDNPPELNGMTTALEPVMSSALLALMPMPDDANLKPDGSFTFHDVMEGTYRVNAFPVPSGYYLKAGNPEVLDSGIAIGRTGATVDLSISPGVGKIQGTVTGGESCAGFQVLLVPDRSSADQRDFHRATSDRACRFTMRNVPPGEYKIFARDPLGSAPLTDPELLQQYVDQAQSLQLKEGGDVNVEVGIVSLGD